MNCSCNFALTQEHFRRYDDCRMQPHILNCTAVECHHHLWKHSINTNPDWNWIFLCSRSTGNNADQPQHQHQSSKRKRTLCHPPTQSLAQLGQPMCGPLLNARKILAPPQQQRLWRRCCWMQHSTNKKIVIADDVDSSTDCGGRARGANWSAWHSFPLSQH